MKGEDNLINLEINIKSTEIAEMVGREHKEVLRDIRNVIEHLGGERKSAQSYFIDSTYRNSQNKELPCFLLTKKGCELYGTRMTGEKGTLFAVKYIERFNDMESVLKLETNTLQVTAKEQYDMELLGAKIAMEILGVDTTSKIKMLETVNRNHGVNTNFLPSYVDEEVTKSLTELLKENKVNISAIKANNKLIELGIIELKERPSANGEVKEFKSLTNNGLRYGKNLINSKSPKETQPHYYQSTFKELIDLLKG